MAVIRYPLFSVAAVGNTPGVGARGDMTGDGSNEPTLVGDTLSPEQIAAATFSRRGAGVDRVEVGDFLGRVARQTAELQRRLSVAEERVASMTAEAAAMRVETRGTAEVARIVAETEDVVARVRQRAADEAASVRAEADAYAATVRAEADAMRRQAEVDVDTYRRETVAHAERLRAQSDQALAVMRRDAERAIRRVHTGVIAELAERSEAVAATERALIDQLQGAAGGLQQVIDQLRERQVRATGPTGLVEAPAGPADELDIDPALAHLPPPPVAMWPTAAGDGVAERRR